jgi:hypothetical protein
MHVVASNPGEGNIMEHGVCRIHVLFDVLDERW